MNVVDFAEGILGIGAARNEVAKCVRQFAWRSTPSDMQAVLLDLSDDLEDGKRTDIEVIRKIGEDNLRLIERAFLNAKT